MNKLYLNKKQKQTTKWHSNPNVSILELSGCESCSTFCFPEIKVWHFFIIFYIFLLSKLTINRI